MVYIKPPIPENVYLNAYLKKYYPNPPLWIRPRLGKVAFPEFAKMYSVTLRYPDCIFIHDDAVWIIEAKIEPCAEAIGQLQFYSQLFTVTPEFEPWWGLPIRLVLLTSRLDKDVYNFCIKERINYVHFDINTLRIVPHPDLPHVRP